MLLVLGGLALLVGIAALYLRQEVLDPQAFGSRAANSLDSSATRDYLAQRLTQDVIEGADPRTIAARPLIESAVAGVVGSSVFRPIVRGAAAQLYGALATKDAGRAVLGLSDGLVLAIEALRQQPGVKLDLPPGFTKEAIDFGERSRTRRLIHAADLVRTLGLALPAAGIALLAAAVALSPRRRRAVGAAGAVLAVVGVLIVLGVAIGRFVVERQVGDGTARDAAGAVWDALVDDLSTWGFAAAVVGLVLWLTAASLLRAVTVPSLLRRSRDWAMRGPQGRLEALGRGAVLVVAAVLLVVAWRTALQLAVLAVAVVLGVQGLSLVLSVVAPAPVGPSPGQRLRGVHRPSLAAAVAALTVVLIGVGAFLGTRAPASYGAENVTTCNGDASLCDRPLNEVAFAATHNSMSSADAGFYRAEQRGTIAAQLRFGIRGLLIDSWYGRPSGNLVSTDFARVDPLGRNKAIGALPPDAAAAFERLRGRIGFRNRGSSRPYLCHVYCEAGATDMVSALTSIRRFLERNPGEVVILDIEDYITPEDTDRAFADAGLLPFVYRHPAGDEWPTLGEMISSDERVVVMTEHNAGGIPWILPAYEGYLEETPYRFTSTKQVEAPASCRPNRGGTGRPFFLVNNWVESSVPSPQDAAKVNAFPALLARAHRCEQVRGHIANLVAIDFYRDGDVRGVVNVLNGLPRSTPPVKPA